MRKDTYRLSANPSSFYLSTYDDTELKVDAAGGTAWTTAGRGDLEFEVHVPYEFGQIRTDLKPSARSVLSQIVEMDVAARAAKTSQHDDDEYLISIVVREFFVELFYGASAWNSDWREYYSLGINGCWRHRGMELPWMKTWRVKDPAAILALDAAYGEDASAVGAVFFADWEGAAPLQAISRRVDRPPADYQPGEFYKRELPVLMTLLDESPLPLSAIVVDGYVWLSADGKPGLGARLYEALGRRVPVVGVAKTKFGDDTWSQPIQRGQSQVSLYVTAAGLDRIDAARRIQRMHGAHRIPTLLKRADELARETLAMH